MDPRVQKMADVMVNFCVAVQPGEWVLLRSPAIAEPLANACVSNILKAGGHPTVQITSEEIGDTFLREASDEQLSFLDPLRRLAIERVDVSISILAPLNTRTGADIDPRRLAVGNKALEPILETMMRRTAEGTLRWSVCVHPTNAAAQDAGMSLRQYEDFVYGAGLLFEPDPVVAWRDLGERQQRIADWLSNKRRVAIKGPGIDLTVGVAGRPWINDDGHLNFPGGEVFTGPVENQTEGFVEFNLPGFYAGHEVDGVRLVFKDGMVIEAGAQTDEAFLQEMLNLDEGARRLGEFAFGLNPGVGRFTKNTLFDEKIGGTVHMALGRAYPESGGTNVSSLHWDMVYDLRPGAEVIVDGELFSRYGEIVI
jgi:aminopeptidase